MVERMLADSDTSYGSVTPARSGRRGAEAETDARDAAHLLRLLAENGSRIWIQ